METQFSGNPKPFGIIGLILAIFCFFFSLIPCVGFYTIIPSLMSIIFCSIAFAYLRQKKENKSVPVAGLIIGVLAISIGIYQYYTFKTVFDTKSKIENSINEIENDISKKIENKALETVKEKIETELNNDSIQKTKKDTL